MPAQPLFAHQIEAVKAALHAIVDEAVEPLLIAASAGEIDPTEAERRTWAVVLSFGRALLAAVLGLLCRRRTEKALAARGLDMDDVYLRMDSRGWASMTSTLGKIRFPWYDYRETRGGPTKKPARVLFPRYGRCASTRMCLEWESALASEHPFRSAEKALTFFTHEAVAIEDTTMARHAVAVGLAVSRRWLYRPRAKIVEILRDRATRDAKTGLPLVYASTDAHMLTRYVDDTWNAKWKAINGVRVWCVDRKTGGIVHLGGEYTWGDCEEVARVFATLRKSGVLPRDGDYGDGLRAQLVLITDGARWIEERVYPLFPEAIKILDAYHVVEHIGTAAAALFGKGDPQARALTARCAAALGLRSQRQRTPRIRKGHTKGSRPATSPPPAEGSIDAVCGELATALTAQQQRAPAVSDLVEFLDDNAYRTDYAGLRARSIQIGSGAMESMHRFGSQLRLKRSGCRWLAETAHAMLNLRLLAKVERWDEYWAQPDLDHQLAAREAA